MNIGKKIKKIIKAADKKKCMKAAGCVIFLTAAIIFTVLCLELEPSDSLRQWYQILASICIAGALMCVFGEDGAKGLKKAMQGFRGFLQGFAKKIAKAIASIFGGRLGKGYQGASLIKDYQDISFKVKKNTSIKKKNQKRYKDMNSSERIRYFYGKLINRQIKKGFSFRSSFTADEIGKRLIQDKKISRSSEVLFEKYNEARYNIQADITEEDVEKIKKIYKNP